MDSVLRGFHLKLIIHGAVVVIAMFRLQSGSYGSDSLFLPLSLLSVAVRCCCDVNVNDFMQLELCEVNA